MTGFRSLLLACALLGLAACEGPGTGSDDCVGKCDDLDTQSVGQLMPRAPSTPGTVSVTRNGESWFFEVIGAKGEIVLLSVEFGERTAALNGVLGVEENGVLAEQYVVEETAGGWVFELRAKNNQVIATSQLYPSEAAAEAAAEETRDLVAGIVQYKAALTDGARFDLSRDGSSWEFALRDDANEPVVVSQQYSRRTDAITGIESVRENGKNPERYEIVGSPPRFVLEAANGEEIAESSSTFSSEEAARTAIDSMRALLESERVANPW